MNESDLLAHIARRSADLASRFGQVVVGPGDDCAVIRTPSGDEMLLTVDHLVEGRHFEPGTPIDLIARKAVARSVSDIAAMGGTPAWGLATGCLPRGYGHGDALFEAMHKWANHWGCPLVGGDISTSDGPMVLTVTVGGVMGTRWVDEWIDAPPEAKSFGSEVTHPVLRNGAKPGDVVYVTGQLGGSFESGKHLSFEPRLREGELCSWRRVDAMIDISDGLGRDAARVARASGVVIEIEAARIPLFSPELDWQRAVGDGEDYELLVVANHPSLPDVVRGLTRIGSVRACNPGESPGVWVTDPNGRRHEVSDWGWDHD